MSSRSAQTVKERKREEKREGGGKEEGGREAGGLHTRCHGTSYVHDTGSPCWLLWNEPIARARATPSYHLPFPPSTLQFEQCGLSGSWEVFIACPAPLLPKAPPGCSRWKGSEQVAKLRPCMGLRPCPRLRGTFVPSTQTTSSPQGCESGATRSSAVSMMPEANTLSSVCICEAVGQKIPHKMSEIAQNRAAVLFTTPLTKKSQTALVTQAYKIGRKIKHLLIINHQEKM